MFCGCYWHNDGGKCVSDLFIKALVFVLCDLENDVYKIYKMFPDFYNKIKTKA